MDSSTGVHELTAQAILNDLDSHFVLDGEAARIVTTYIRELIANAAHEAEEEAEATGGDNHDGPVVEG